LKFGVFVHPQRPKIPKKDIETILKSLSLQVAETSTAADIALVIGGDGIFSYYGRNLSIPLLFVGVPDTDILGSKSRLAEVTFDHFVNSLKRLKKGNYKIVKRKMFSVKYNTFKPVDILTDIYVERGIFAGCIRYTTSVSQNVIISIENNNKEDNIQKSIFTDFVIGNGVIISTSFGSTGYYSYIDKIVNTTKIKSQLFNDNRIGVCHILPTFAIRKKMSLKKVKDIKHIRYSVPFQSIIEINIVRDANVRLYGTTSDSKGVVVKKNNPIVITPSKRTAKIIRLLS
jgi:mRNA-degrading endonuclease RelE of RelBE toxin-antitoxin system